jgi:hypothetical protein
VIARKNEGKRREIKDGEVYYRYSGRTQVIRFAELHKLMQERLERNNENWRLLMSRIASAGPANAAVLDMSEGKVHRGDEQVLVVDEELLDKIKFSDTGEEGAGEGEGLKIMGDVYPVKSLEVRKIVEKRLTELYPLTATELLREVKKRFGSAKQGDVWSTIKENGIKLDKAYSAYNFRSRKQEEEFEKAGILPSTTPSIYNWGAVDFIVNVLRDRKAKAGG